MIPLRQVVKISVIIRLIVLAIVNVVKVLDKKIQKSCTTPSVTPPLIGTCTAVADENNTCKLIQ